MKLPPYFSVFPVSGKKPLVSWAEYSNRLATAEERQTWSFKFGQNHSLGIATGAISKVLVLDDDGGLDLAKYPMPRTLTQTTPRGGKHYFLRWTPELEKKITTKVGIIEGVDVRGTGGFAVFYEFNQPYWTVPLASPPRWLIDILPDKDRSQTAIAPTENGANKSHLQELLDDIKPGNRNDSFTRIAGSLRNRGYSPSDIYGVLVSKAREVGFGEQELKTVCESVGRYTPKQIIDDTDDTLDAFFKEVKPREWIIPGLVAKESITFLAGLPKSSKSWIMIDLALEAARENGKWLGKFPIERCNVMYIEQERSKGEIQRRFLALMKEKGLKKSDLTLRIKSQTHIKIDLENSFEALKKELREKKPTLVLVDSFITFHTKNVMDQISIMPVLERIKELRDEFKCSFVFIYHERKTAFNDEQKDPSFEDMVGSVFISSVADHCFSVRRQDVESSMVYNTANNLGPTESPFLVKVVDITEDKSVIKVEGY